MAQDQLYSAPVTIHLRECEWYEIPTFTVVEMCIQDCEGASSIARIPDFQAVVTLSSTGDNLFAIRGELTASHRAAVAIEGLRHSDQVRISCLSKTRHWVCCRQGDDGGTLIPSTDLCSPRFMVKPNKQEMPHFLKLIRPQS